MTLYSRVIRLFESQSATLLKIEQFVAQRSSATQPHSDSLESVKEKVFNASRLTRRPCKYRYIKRPNFAVRREIAVKAL